MPLKGPTTGLVRLSAELKRLGPKAVRAVGKAFEGELVTLVQLGFRKGRAPDGSAWAPLQARDGQPLRDTGRLMNSFTAKASGSVVKVGTNTPYAPYHQEGTSRMPARPMLPDGDDLPAPWQQSLDEAADEAVALVLTKLPRP
ncbi:MAG TPA: phage virion morphogenesis protein [Polyangiaceae bacterium]|nr:phage virion morphogenesis protein [Polyangiaceae bacterium]